MTQRMKPDESFTPCPVRDGDELFPNGIFEFNITRMLEHLESHPDAVDLADHLHVRGQGQRRTAGSNRSRLSSSMPTMTISSSGSSPTVTRRTRQS